jgi:hypothetical protein
MQFKWYVDGLRRQMGSLVANRDFIRESGMKLRSNWGGYTTKGWLAELDRRINELSAIITAFERKYAA